MRKYNITHLVSESSREIRGLNLSLGRFLSCFSIPNPSLLISNFLPEYGSEFSDMLSSADWNWSSCDISVLGAGQIFLPPGRFTPDPPDEDKIRCWYNQPFSFRPVSRSWEEPRPACLWYPEKQGSLLPFIWYIYIVYASWRARRCPLKNNKKKKFLNVEKNRF